MTGNMVQNVQKQLLASPAVITLAVAGDWHVYCLSCQREAHKRRIHLHYLTVAQELQPPDMQKEWPNGFQHLLPKTSACWDTSTHIMYACGLL
jgi:hypothetical protein